MVTSGVRIGTPAVTTRGATITDAVQVADWIADVLRAPNDQATVTRVRGQVGAWCAEHPVYPHLQDGA
jgi:glycine hydroxymethyltransferase